MNTMVEENREEVPLADSYHLTKAVKNGASRTIVRTSKGSWTLAQLKPVYYTAGDLLRSEFKLGDVYPIDRQDCDTVARLARMARRLAMAALEVTMITTTIEVRHSKRANLPSRLIFYHCQKLAVTDSFPIHPSNVTALAVP